MIRYTGSKEDFEHLEFEAEQQLLEILWEESLLSGEEPPQWWLDAAGKEPEGGQ